MWLMVQSDEGKFHVSNKEMNEKLILTIYNGRSDFTKTFNAQKKILLLTMNEKFLIPYLAKKNNLAQRSNGKSQINLEINLFILFS